LLPEEEEAVREVFQELLLGHFPNQFANYWVAKDGTRRLISWSNTVLVDEAGLIEYVISTGIDVTERKEAEETLRRDRDFVALVMQTSPAGITIVNREGQIVFANAQAKRVLGLTEHDLNGLAYNAPTWQITDYEGKPMPDEALPLRRVLDAERAVYDVEHAIERPNGERVLLSVNGAPLFDASGWINRVVFAIEDVTERVQAEQALRDSEERFRDLYENAPSAYLSVDADGVIARCNKKTHTLLGYPVEELIGYSIIELCADVPHGKGKAKQVWARFQDGEPITDEELQMKRADDMLLWISLTMNAVRDATGKLLEGRATVVDISERKQAEEARERELYSLEQLSGTARASITAESFGLNPMRSALPTVFEGVVQRYEHLLGLALERRAYKVEYNLAEDLCVLAERLGALKAGPRDVVDVHVTVLKRKSEGASIPKAQAYLDEGRLMVLELMGYLASYYRNYLIGVGQVSPANVSEVEGEARE
jgi:PAS domain S-box-containing protein